MDRCATETMAGGRNQPPKPALGSASRRAEPASRSRPAGRGCCAAPHPIDCRSSCHARPWRWAALRPTLATRARGECQADLPAHAPHPARVLRPPPNYLIHPCTHPPPFHPLCPPTQPSLVPTQLITVIPVAKYVEHPVWRRGKTHVVERVGGGAGELRPHAGGRIEAIDGAICDRRPDSFLSIYPSPSIHPSINSGVYQPRTNSRLNT